MAKANTKKTTTTTKKEKEIDKTNWAFNTRNGHPKLVAQINKDIKAGKMKELTYSAGMADMLGTLYDFRINGVSVTLRIDGQPNVLPECLFDFVEAKVNKIINLNAANQGKISERMEIS